MEPVEADPGMSGDELGWQDYGPGAWGVVAGEEKGKNSRISPKKSEVQNLGCRGSREG
jgi:hypothetical protein